MSDSGFTASEEAQTWLRECDAPNLHFHVSQEAEPTAGFPDVATAVAFWCEAAGVEPFALDVSNEASFTTFLARLRGVKEYVVQEMRQPQARDNRKAELLALCAERWLRTDHSFLRGFRSILAWFAVANVLEGHGEPALRVASQWMRT